MKNLVFLENNNLYHVQSASKTLQRALFLVTGLSHEVLGSMQLIHGVGYLKEEELTKILFNPENCIFTFSVYTGESRSQLFEYLTFCGKQAFKDLTYVDGSGKIIGVLNNYLWGDKRKHSISSAIILNNILTLVEENDRKVLKKLKINFDKKLITLEDFNLYEYLNNEEKR